MHSEDDHSNNLVFSGFERIFNVYQISSDECSKTVLKVAFSAVKIVREIGSTKASKTGPAHESNTTS